MISVLITSSQKVSKIAEKTSAATIAKTYLVSFVLFAKELYIKDVTNRITAGINPIQSKYVSTLRLVKLKVIKTSSSAKQRVPKNKLKFSCQIIFS